MAPPVEGVRERRRRELRREIKAAALQLALEYGYDKVTVEMISARVGVSPRTFFNHFAGRDEAVLFGPPVPPPADTARFVAAGPAAPRAVLADLLAMLVAGLAEAPPERRAMRDLYELTRGHPALLAGMLAQFDAAERALAGTVAERLGPDGPPELPTLLAALALTAVRVGLEQWSDSAGSDSAGEAAGAGPAGVGGTAASGPGRSAGDSAPGGPAADSGHDSPVPYVQRAAATLDALFAP